MNKDKQNTAHHYAVQDLQTFYENKIEKEKHDSAAMDEGLRLANEFAKDFYPDNNLKDTEYKTKDTQYAESVRSKQIEYDEKLYNLVVKFNDKINKAEETFGNGVKDAFTNEMISGVNLIKTVRYLPPLELLSEDMVVEYMSKWESAYNNDAKMSNSIKGQKNSKTQQMIEGLRKNC